MQLMQLEIWQFHPEWDMAPVAPFRGQLWHESRSQRDVIGTQDLTGIMDWAGRTLPAESGWAMTSHDANGWIIFGYVCFASTLVECGAPAWYGCRAAYEWLERSERFDRMDLAVWESTARRLGQ